MQATKATSARLWIPLSACHILNHLAVPEKGNRPNRLLFTALFRRLWVWIQLHNYNYYKDNWFNSFTKTYVNNFDLKWWALTKRSFPSVVSRHETAKHSLLSKECLKMCSLISYISYLTTNINSALIQRIKPYTWLYIIHCIKPNLFLDIFFFCPVQTIILILYIQSAYIKIILLLLLVLLVTKYV